MTPQTVVLQAPLSMGILKARMMESVAMPFSWSRDGIRTSHVSSFGKQVLYHWATRKPCNECLLLSSCSVVSNFLQPHGLQHARLPCLSSYPEVCSNSCPSSQWCHLAILSSVLPLSSCLQSFPALGSFLQWVCSLHKVAKVLELHLQYQPFQWIFRTYFLQDRLIWSPCCPRDSQESFPIPQFKSVNWSVLSLFNCPTLTSVHDYWKKHSFEYMDLCWQSDVSAF